MHLHTCSARRMGCAMQSNNEANGVPQHTRLLSALQAARSGPQIGAWSQAPPSGRCQSLNSKSMLHAMLEFIQSRTFHGPERIFDVVQARFLQRFRAPAIITIKNSFHRR